MKSSYFVSLLLTIFLAGCSSISVRRDFDPSADFSTLKTYAWQYEKQPQTGNPRVDNDLLDRRIRDAVERELQSKGYIPGNRGDADFLVAYFIEYKQRIGGSSFSFGIGAGNYGRYGGVGYNTSISDYDEGHLTIDILNRQTEDTIWRGVGIRETYEYSKPEKITKVVNKAVSKVLAKFPPKP